MEPTTYKQLSLISLGGPKKEGIGTFPDKLIPGPKNPKKLLKTQFKKKGPKKRPGGVLILGDPILAKGGKTIFPPKKSLKGGSLKPPFWRKIPKKPGAIYWGVTCKNTP